MTFLGADVEQLRAWSRAAQQQAAQLNEQVVALRRAVDSVMWVGPDRDAFLEAFASSADCSSSTMLIPPSAELSFAERMRSQGEASRCLLDGH